MTTLFLTALSILTATANIGPLKNANRTSGPVGERGVRWQQFHLAEYRDEGNSWDDEQALRYEQELAAMRSEVWWSTCGGDPRVDNDLFRKRLLLETANCRKLGKPSACVASIGTPTTNKVVLRLLRHRHAARGTSPVDRDAQAAALASRMGALETTPLHWAAACSDPTAIEILVAEGSSPDAPDAAQRSPLVYAAIAGREDNLRALLRHGARGSTDRSEAMLTAALMGSWNLVRVLLEHGTDPNIKAEDGRSVLDLAIADDQVGGVEALTYFGASLDGDGGTRETPLEIALRQHRLGIASVLRFAEARRKGSLTSAHSCSLRRSRDCATACRAGSAGACYLTGILLMVDVKRRDLGQALAAFSIACGGRVADACNNAGVILARGLEHLKDLDGAKELFSRGCDLGDANACANLERLAPTRPVLPDGMCMATISSKPWAEVSIDGKPTGKITPLVNYLARCGEHRLTFRNPDMKIDHEESVTFTAGKPFKKIFSLVENEL